MSANAKTVTGAGYKRNLLGECLPLATPFSLHIFLSHRCNLKCNFCIHSLSTEEKERKGFEQKIMSLELFKKCIDEMLFFPDRLKVLIFAGWGEPLTHPDIVEMVAYAKQKNCAERIEIVSNGVLLSHQVSDGLIDAGLDRIRISIQGLDSAAYLRVAGVNVKFDLLLDNIVYFHNHRGYAKLYIKTVDAAVPTEADREKFYRIFSNICDEIAVEQIIPVIKGIDHSKFGSDFGKRHCGGNAENVTVCPFPFYMSVIHPDGSYAPCCSTEPPVALGNIETMPIGDIWSGERLREFRHAHLAGNRGACSLCKACPRPQYDIQQGDNIDTFAMKLLTKYK